MLLPCRSRCQDKPRSRPSDISENSASEIATNLHQLSTRKDGLRRLEDELSRSVKPFNPDNSLEGVMSPPPLPNTSPVHLDKRTKDMLERKKNWIFMNPDEVAAGGPTSELFHLNEKEADGSEKKQLSPLEQFYEKITGRSRGVSGSNPAKGQGKKDDPLNPSAGRDPRLDPASQDDGNQQTSKEDQKRTAKKLFSADGAANVNRKATTANSSFDIFGLSKAEPVAWEIEAQKSRMDDYRKMLGLPPAPEASDYVASPLGKLSDLMRPTPTTTTTTPALTGLPSTGTTRPQDFGTQLGTINPFPSSSALQDIGSKSYNNSLGLSPALPKTPAPKVTPPIPTFTAPTRVF